MLMCILNNNNYNSNNNSSITHFIFFYCRKTHSLFRGETKTVSINYCPMESTSFFWLSFYLFWLCCPHVHTCRNHSSSLQYLVGQLQASISHFHSKGFTSMLMSFLVQSLMVLYILLNALYTPPHVIPSTHTYVCMVCSTML